MAPQVIVFLSTFVCLTSPTESLAALELIAQVPVAAIRGTVTDSTGGVIVNAAVSVRQNETGSLRRTTTRADGGYELANLEPGRYDVRVSSPGLQTAARRVSLRVGDHPTLDFELEVGPVSDQVEIVHYASGVNVTDYKIAGSIGRDQVEQLPLNGRSFLELARLEPGVSVEAVANPGGFANNYHRVAIAGAPYLQTRVLVDGAAVEDRINGGTSQNISHETVQEFHIGTFNLDLATGATGVGAITVVTRRGSNDLRGSAFFYHRDDSLAAYPALRRSLLSPDPSFARPQSGFSVGGPFKTDRFFWFANYERHAQDGAIAVANNHPIFSKLDVVHPSPLDFDLFNARFDGSLGTRHRTFVRLSRDSNRSVAPFSQGATMPSNWQASRNLATQVQAGVSSVLTSRIINDFRVSFSRLTNDLDPMTAAGCSNASACQGLGAPELLVFDAPSLRIGHFVSAPKQMRQRAFHLADNVEWQRGAHGIRAGGEWEHLALNSIHAFYSQPQLTLWGPTDLLRSAELRPLFDALPASLRGASAAPPTYDEMLQLPLRSFIVGIGDPRQPGPYHHDSVSHPDVLRAYVQDRWTVRSDLTITFGLAYLGRTKIFNRDLNRPEYLSPLLGGNLQPPRRGQHVFDPSVGLAWSIGRGRPTVVRAGAGVYRDRADFFLPYLERGALGPSGNQRVTVDGSTVGLTFLSGPTAFTGRDVLPLLPGIVADLSARYGDGTNLAVRGIEVLKQGERIFDPEHTTPSTIHVSAGVQRELAANLVVSADFVWRSARNVGAFQYVPQIDFNRFNRPRVTGMNAVTKEVSFVRDPVIPLCSVSQARALDPADQCSTGPINGYTSGAGSRYQGLHLKLDRRFDAGLQFTASYALGNHVGFVEFTDHANFDSRAGNIASDRRHRLTVSAIYDIPAYRGHSRWVQALTNGWTVALISQSDSPPPLNTILAGLDLDGDGLSRTLLPGVPRHNSLGRGLTVSELTDLVQQYNADVEARSERVTNADGTVTIIRPRTPFNQIISLITLPETFASGDSFITQDVRVTRRILVKNRVRLSLIAEVFNVFNVANLTGYSNVLNQVNYGQPSARAGQIFGTGGPRAAQFAARIEF